ncbi:hypothetical protein HYH03_016946 [Edaphochlamys debaryana]|uniref:Uncharacterized protein n=1 Tax=Edaphochlamys debaryana TaxID=47281 RepID=A0A836BPD2_9CHLO|nr:hypothetical protein HYH03_016946 [Edaphochlamys debaryana]|eukprot:KAG2484211.1 hypothetical protein HYH03_016946 [Edaphochlamys debaryana]
MPPRALDRGGAAAPRDPAPAPAPTLRASFAALPSLVEQLLLAVRSGRQPAASAEEALGRLLQQLAELPHVSPRPSAEVAELLSSNPKVPAALLRLHAAALRPGGEGGTGALERGSGNGGGGSGGSGEAGTQWSRNALDATIETLNVCVPLPPSRHALGVLRFARGMLRAQALHVLSRNLAVAAAALDCAVGGGGGGGGRGRASSPAATVSAVDEARAELANTTMHLASATLLLFNDMTYAGLLFQGEGVAARALPLTGLAAEVAAARAAAVEDYARALAESGILEHAARLLLLLQAVRSWNGMPEALSTGLVTACFRLSWHGFACESDKPCSVVVPDGAVDACPRAVSPAAAALLRSALRGRCVQTAVLVYGVGVLRLADRGSSYGRPAALQTAGLSLSGPTTGNARLSALDLLLRQLASPAALRPPGRAASAALALRVGRTALGSTAWELPPALAAATSIPPPPRPAALPVVWCRG